LQRQIADNKEREEKEKKWRDEERELKRFQDAERQKLADEERKQVQLEREQRRAIQNNNFKIQQEKFDIAQKEHKEAKAKAAAAGGFSFLGVAKKTCNTFSFGIFCN
jgi:hypothetical protein